MKQCSYLHIKGKEAGRPAAFTAQQNTLTHPVDVVMKKISPVMIKVQRVW